MILSARFISAAILVVAIGACSPDPARLLAEKSGTVASQKMPGKGSRVAAERPAAASRATAKANAAAYPLAFLFRSHAQADVRIAHARSPAVAKSASRAGKTANKAVLRAKVLDARRFSKAVNIVRRKGGPGSIHAQARATRNALLTSAKASPVTLAPPTVQQPKPLPVRVQPTPTAPTDVIVYDVVAGIKTLHRANGTVEEEAFDPGKLQAIKAARHSDATRIMIVNEAGRAWNGRNLNAQPAEPATAIKAGPR